MTSSDLFQRHESNPILTAADWPYTVNAVFNSECDAPAIGSLWAGSGLGTAGVGQGASFFSGYRFVG